MNFWMIAILNPHVSSISFFSYYIVYAFVIAYV